jgi:hypothetical protein
MNFLAMGTMGLSYVAQDQSIPVALTSLKNMPAFQSEKRKVNE